MNDDAVDMFDLLTTDCDYNYSGVGKMHDAKNLQGTTHVLILFNTCICELEI